MDTYAAGLTESIRIVDRLIERGQTEGAVDGYLLALALVRAEILSAPPPARNRRRSDPVHGPSVREVGLQNLTDRWPGAPRAGDRCPCSRTACAVLNGRPVCLPCGVAEMEPPDQRTAALVGDLKAGL